MFARLASVVFNTCWLVTAVGMIAGMAIDVTKYVNHSFGGTSACCLGFRFYSCSFV